MAQTPNTAPRGSRRADLDARQQQALESALRSTLQAKMKQWAIFGVLGLALLLFITYVVLETTAPLPGEAVATEGRGHTDPPQRFTYANYPPSSGNHYGVVPPASAYVMSEEPMLPEFYLHALEHGGIVAVYNCRPDDCGPLRQSLDSLYGQLSKSKWGHTKLMVTQDPAIDPGLVVLAWDRRMKLDKFDADKIKAFYAAYMDRGPEDAP
ncbi:MAG: DUF3105 domain-containing protein [Dehalococcoidia bacterium]|nr:DUF3105 domain-containing protein [Dehalococcoidia bacterium]